MPKQGKAIARAEILGSVGWSSGQFQLYFPKRLGSRKRLGALEHQDGCFPGFTALFLLCLQCFFFHVDGLYSSVLPQAIPLTGKFEHGSQKIALEIYHDSRKSLPCREHFTAIHAHDQKAPGSKATAMVPCRNGRSRASSSDTQVGRKES